MYASLIYPLPQVTLLIASKYGPKHAKAWHTNFMPDQVAPVDDDPSTFSERDLAALLRREIFMTTGTGYTMEQSTKPQTLGYSLSDSPVGLLAWIYEKFVIWTDSYSWKDDEGEDSMSCAHETH